jgi:tetratricopeptide (TPR) repeat protein
MDIEQSLQQAIDHYSAGNLAEALELCLAVLDQAGDNVDALHLGGLLAFQQGQAETAANLIWKAVQLDPAFTDGYLNLGQVYQALGREEDAAACFRKVLELAPGHAEALAFLGETAPETAPQEEQTATMSIQDALRFAVEQHQAGDFQQAEIVYRAVLNTESNNPDALHLLGILCAQQSRFDEGIGLIRQAIAVAPRAEMYRNLGQAYRDSGNAAEAEACFAKARELGN